MSGIELGVECGVQTIRLARPEKKNAINAAMYDGLRDALSAGDCDPGIAVHMIAGAPGIFCAGNDIGEFARGPEGAAAALRFIRQLPAVAKPMVAVVDGPAVGIGTTLLLHCDLVYASTAATFHTPFLDLGLVPEAASSLLAPRLMGSVRAFELLVLANPFDAMRAMQSGLVNAVLPSDQLEQAARAAALRLAQKPPEALRLARRLLRGDVDEIQERIETEARLFKERLLSAEAREAFAAFIEKRQPRFPMVGG